MTGEQPTDRRRPKRAVRDQADATDPAGLGPEAPEAAPAYRVGRWARLPHYRCAHCRYETLDHAAIERHVEKTHNKPAAGGQE